MGSGGRSAHCGPGAPESGAAPSGGRLRPGCSRTVRPDPEVHVPGRPAAVHRPTACCPRPHGRQRIRGPSRCQPGDANYCGRGLAGGSATCRSGGCGAASRRAPSQGHPEPSARSRTDKGARARCRRRFAAGLTVPGQASPQHTAPSTPSQARNAPCETAAELAREASPEPPGRGVQA